jgi:putative transposase
MLIRRTFTEYEMRILGSNPNVSKVTEKGITYRPEFKLHAVRSQAKGRTPTQIFLDAGFDINLIGIEKPKDCLRRWRQVYISLGERGLLQEQRGSKSTGRQPNKELTIEDKLRRAEAKVKLLEAENEFLKKLEFLERQAKTKKLTASEHFELISSTVHRYKIKGLTRYLCEIADVSASGYYRWLQAVEARRCRDVMDEQDVVLIKEHFDILNQKAGALTIKMHLERRNHVIMNHKKIRRLMNKFNIVTKVRRANPYRKIAKATQEHTTCPNLLERHFDQGEPEKIFLTDITYMKYNEGTWAYLSCVKDGSTKEILAHYLSSSLEMPIVEITLKKLMKRLDNHVHPNTIFHSDQGVHYTHPRFQQQVKKAGFQQSMSRKGNCWDNASMESFFGHMKDEMEFKDCQSIEELRKRIHNYIEFYNSYRYQWTLNKMTPEEYRSHLLAA